MKIGITKLKNNHQKQSVLFHSFSNSKCSLSFILILQINTYFVYNVSFFHSDNVMSNHPMEPIPPVRLNQQRPTFAVDGDTMERLFQALFYRIAVLYARTIPKHIRRLGETAILVMVRFTFSPQRNSEVKLQLKKYRFS